MKLFKLLPLAALCVAPMLFALAPQKRASQDKKVVTFEERLAAASKGWTEKHYGSATTELKAALTLCQAKHREVILAAMPPAPEGWKLVPQPKEDDGDAAVAAMLGMGSNLIATEQAYTNERGDRMTIGVLINSPMIQMMSMQFSNPAYMEKGAELIEYASDKAVLKTGNNNAEMQLVLDGKHLVTCEARQQSGDWLLSVMSQENVDRLKNAVNQ